VRVDFRGVLAGMEAWLAQCFEAVVGCCIVSVSAAGFSSKLPARGLAITPLLTVHLLMEAKVDHEVSRGE
jgi:hypothetical protein